ncbi:hypothetical protein QJS04_geneDACA002603 [Acorus gramineus]|uniref:Oxidative stress 3 n=1 Tax=Acorus gramineus TaxID=55184 RepID=A0AAV9AS64_ACOGR|nr:hypothetical protein QJS04_geneDACA002603 [Acorus gramineus]
MSEEEESGASDASCSSNLVDDDESVSSGPLYELSSLMDQLPIKRGLSVYFQGKSQSFTSLSDVSCLEDLVKKDSTYKKKMKQSHRSYSLGSLKRTISKKTQRGSFSSLIASNGGGCLVASCRPPVAMQKNM